ncbi:hypothetical protein HanHA300_Chr16g0627561 [Helianthus annuus]|nr:hypothetical protein HanHA300_Chr16g0627561 [Helianthus annuus]KAJ0462031.1 hypothetical protein HanHA89_Chr16g0678901 [Helianthus annuus]KAJ0642425.1 hypothetical protein HanLR1_Chr16g0638111 [Helianthus annuus]KAJ0646298.1 hypothetical protein HanOQP8_Chr16g0633531 [Helianthus annuus]
MRVLVHSGFFVKQSVLTTPGGNDEEGGEGYFLTSGVDVWISRLTKGHLSVIQTNSTSLIKHEPFLPPTNVTLCGPTLD